MSSHVDAFEENNLDETGLCQPGMENTGRWSSEEHKLFLDGVQAHGKNWKKIVALIPTRTVVQVRTHAQKFFKKLSKAQASGDDDLDPSTLMSTTDAAGKPRLSSFVRSSRRYSLAHPSAGGMGGKLRNLPMRQSRGRNVRRLGIRIGRLSPQERYSDSSSSSSSMSSSTSSSDNNRNNRNMNSTITSSINGSNVHDTISNADKSGNGGEGDDGDENKEVTSGAECDGTNRTGSGNRALDARTTFETSRGFDFASITYVGGQAGGGAKKSRTPKKSTRTYPRKPFKIGHVRERSATDARALAWEAAASMGEDDRTRLKYGNAPRSNWISPTSVSDIKDSLIPFSRKYPEGLDASTTTHLPQHITPTWCIKPPNNWIDGVVDSTDAGPFRWFIDERSLAHPGAFFQPPAETWWSGSYTTDASTSVDTSSGGEAVEADCKVAGSKPLASEPPRIASTASQREVGATDKAKTTSTLDGVEDSSRSKQRGSAGHTAPADGKDAPRSSADALEEANVAGVDNVDFSCGLWTDRLQESPSPPFTCGLGLGPPSQTEPLWNAPLPTLDEEEAMGFLALDESDDTVHVP
ncbi:unnamed protein product [Ascophyllum nodosum]